MDNSREPPTRTRLYNRRRRSFMRLSSSFSALSFPASSTYQYTYTVYVLYIPISREHHSTRAAAKPLPRYRLPLFIITLLLYCRYILLSY